jgi:hypothetical protein
VQPGLTYNNCLEMLILSFFNTNHVFNGANQVITMFHDRSLSRHQPFDWLDMQCCLPRQHCTERKKWLHIKDPGVKIVNIFGIQTVLGNADFHKESYRTCELHEFGEIDHCP